MRNIRFLPALLIYTACAGCGSADSPANQPTTPLPTASESALANSPIDSISGAPQLEPLQAGEAEGLQGELACSFVAAGPDPLLIARADVSATARATAALRMGGKVRTLTGGTGGFGALEKGATFSGDGLKVTIVPGARVPDTGEEVVRQAVLTLRTADLEQKTDGRWRCGP